MSLDVTLTIAGPEHRDPPERIFIRENGRRVEITRAEWDARYPGQEPVVTVDADPDGTVYSANITHNLGQMAVAASLYQPLWRPEELGITTAGQLRPLLEEGLACLEADPERYREFNPANGWGNYEGLVAFVRDYLAACRRWPEATVRAWR